MSGEKKELREEARARLKALSLPERVERGQRAVKRLLASPEYAASKIIFAYYSVAPEMDTHALIANGLADSKTVGLPRTQKTDCSMHFHSITHLVNDMEVAHFKFHEPKAALPIIPADQAGLIIVPGLAFDLRGNRLGRGAGYYDRYLPQAKNAVVCALAFECQILNNIPSQNHDKPVHLIFTEDRTLNCSAS